MKSNTKKKSGFTLLETIVAIFLLSLAIVGFLTVMTRGISIGTYAKDEMIASFLAQDAMEFIRAKKNENILAAPTLWLTGFKGPGGPCRDTSGANHTCRVDSTNDLIPAVRCQPPTDPSPGVCRPLSYNTSTGLYGYGSGGTWVSTKFTRSITMEEIAPDREVRVTVTITFPRGGTTKTTRFYQNMFNVL